MILIFTAAHAGVLGTAAWEDLYALDSRTFGYREIAFTDPAVPWGASYEFGDIAFDPSGRNGQPMFQFEYGYNFSPLPNCLYEYEPISGLGGCRYDIFGDIGVARDDSGDIVVLPINGEYFPHLDTFVRAGGDAFVTNDAFGNEATLFPLPPELWALSLAWDEDLKVLVGGGTVNNLAFAIYLFHPETYQTLAYSTVDVLPWSLTFMYDLTPNPEPVLFVSGECPGDLLITVADATPGQPVHIAWGTRTGRAPIPAGPCRGTRTGLSNPHLGTTLTADSWGLATTTITVNSCSNMLIQALDEGLCEMTEVDMMPVAP